MPLKKGSSNSAIAANIKELRHSGWPQRQSIAIAESNAGKTKMAAGESTMAASTLPAVNRKPNPDRIRSLLADKSAAAQRLSAGRKASLFTIHRDGQLIGTSIRLDQHEPFSTEDGHQYVLQGSWMNGERLHRPEAIQLSRLVQRLGELFRFDKTVPTRVPRATSGPAPDYAANPHINLASSLLDPYVSAKNLRLFLKYPNFQTGVRQSAIGSLDRIVQHMKRNLLFLHDITPKPIRDQAKLWYDGAHVLSKKLAAEYKIPHAAAAGVIAALSPQMDWFKNYDLARRLIDIASGQQDRTWDAMMDRGARRLLADSKSSPEATEKMARAVRRVKGKQFGKIKNLADQAMWLRVFDKAYNPRTFQIINPDGSIGDIQRTKSGNPANVTWGTTPSIAKALKIFYNPDIDTISEALGKNHKIRNFYNNIIDPDNKNGFVTIDTHAVGANLLLPVGGSSAPVKHNFGGGGSAKSILSGVSGTYGIHSEPYVLAAAERGLLPREMQSIAWETVRGLFTPERKRNKNIGISVAKILQGAARGHYSEDEARKRILETVGPIDPPRLVRGTSRICSWKS